MLEKNVYIDIDVPLTDKNKWQVYYIDEKLSEYIGTFPNIKKLEDAKNLNSYQAGRETAIRRIIQNLLYDIRPGGFETGLITHNAFIYGNNDKGSSHRIVDDHIYSRNLSIFSLIELRKSGRISELKDLYNYIAFICSSIKVTADENREVAGIVDKEKMNFFDLLNMEHYKVCNINLAYVNKRGKYITYKYITNKIKELIVPNIKMDGKLHNTLSYKILEVKENKFFDIFNGMNGDDIHKSFFI